MAAAIPGAKYRKLAGGTHFALIEQPARLNGWLRQLLERCGPRIAAAGKAEAPGSP